MTPEKIDYFQYSEVTTMLFHALDGLLDDVSNPMSVVLTINGQQASVVKMIKALIEFSDERIEERAKDLVKERCVDKIDDMIKRLNYLKESVIDDIREAGFKNVDDDPDYWYGN